jgi:hypothetical protein
LAHSAGFVRLFDEVAGGTSDPIGLKASRRRGIVAGLRWRLKMRCRLTAEVRVMEGNVSLGLASDDPAEIESAFSRLLEQLDEVCEQMQRDQAEIEQIKAETRALKTDSDALKAETRAILATLRAAK